MGVFGWKWENKEKKVHKIWDSNNFHSKFVLNFDKILYRQGLQLENLSPKIKLIEWL